MKKFMQDDKVSYVGSKFAKEIGNKIGWIISEVKNEKDVFCCEFGDESYVMPAKSLTEFKAQPNKETGPEIRINRRRVSEDE